ncbi:MAG: hypothetical protein LUH05_08900, partial [Candidatus Gastranaerophilales bacterium]|nr:hypothetical protein [Candidatus Gastranaerophilales bacterium]
MISNTNSIFNEFNTYSKPNQLVSVSGDKQKEQINKKETRLLTNMLAATPGIIGIGTGTQISRVYSNKAKKQLVQGITSYNTGLQKGFECSPLASQLNDMMHACNTDIKNVAASIETITGNIASTTDNAMKELYNNELTQKINLKKEFENTYEQIKAQFQSLYDKAVSTPLDDYI